MSNILHTRKNDRWIRHHTSSIISNDDAETHLRVFNQQKKVFKMSIAKAQFIYTDSSIIGYFQETYKPTSVNIPSGINTNVIFSGWADSDTALSQSSTYASIPIFINSSNRVLSLGGGNNNGVFTSANLTTIQGYSQQGQTGPFKGYNCLMFDIEGLTQPPTSQFIQTFNIAKNNGFTVFATVSYSGNAGVPIPTDLLAALLSSTDITYLVPQIYTNGDENPPPVTSNGVNWTPWKTAVPKIVVAIPFPIQYDVIETWFSQCMNITLSGFIAWNNDTTQPSNSPGPISCSGGGGGGGGSNFNITLSITNNTTFAYVNPPSYQKDTTLTIVPSNSGLVPTSPSTGFLVASGGTWVGTTTSAATILLNFSGIFNANDGNISLGNGVQTGFAFGAGNMAPNLFSALVIVTDANKNVLSSDTFNDAISHNIGPQSPPYITSGSTISITYSGQAGP
jgi:hypothetical protein